MRTETTAPLSSDARGQLEASMRPFSNENGNIKANAEPDRRNGVGFNEAVLE